LEVPSGISLGSSSKDAPHPSQTRLTGARASDVAPALLLRGLGARVADASQLTFHTGAARDRQAIVYARQLFGSNPNALPDFLNVCSTLSWHFGWAHLEIKKALRDIVPRVEAKE